MLHQLKWRTPTVICNQGYFIQKKFYLKTKSIQMYFAFWWKWYHAWYSLTSHIVISFYFVSRKKMGPFKLKREYLLASVCVILRVPSLFIMEVWFRTDPQKAVESKAVDPGHAQFITTAVYYSSKQFFQNTIKILKINTCILKFFFLLIIQIYYRF